MACVNGLLINKKDGGEFKKRYHKELEDKRKPLEQLKTKNKKGVVILLYAAKDEIRNNAVVLKDILR